MRYLDVEYCTAHDGWNTPPPGNSLFFLKTGSGHLILWYEQRLALNFFVYKQLVTGNRVLIIWFRPQQHEVKKSRVEKSEVEDGEMGIVR